MADQPSAQSDFCNGACRGCTARNCDTFGMEQAGGLEPSTFDDGRLWVWWEISMSQGGRSWMAEGIGPNGFDRQACGVTATSWGANRQIRRYTRQWRKEAGAR